MNIIKTNRVLIDGFSKKSDQDFSGRSDQNSVVVFPKIEGLSKGDYVDVLAESCTSATLIGQVVQQ